MSIAAGLGPPAAVPAGFAPGVNTGSSTVETHSAAPGGTVETITPQGGGSPPGGSSGVLPVGTYILGALVAVAMSNTRAGPLVVGFLVAAVIYNAGQIIGNKGVTNA